MEWIDVNDWLPEDGECVLVSCDKMGRNGEAEVLTAVRIIHDEWYAYFPYDQLVYPTHWMPLPKPFKTKKL